MPRFDGPALRRTYLDAGCVSDVLARRPELAGKKAAVNLAFDATGALLSAEPGVTGERDITLARCVGRAAVVNRFGGGVTTYLDAGHVATFELAVRLGLDP